MNERGSDQNGSEWRNRSTALFYSDFWILRFVFFFFLEEVPLGENDRTSELAHIASPRRIFAPVDTSLYET